MATQAYRAFLQPQIASDQDFMAMLKISYKPKLIKGAPFSLPTVKQLAHEDQLRGCLCSSLLAAECARPCVAVSFHPDAMTFSFELKLSNSRAAKGAIQVRAIALDDGFFPCFDLRSEAVARESCRSLLFKFWP